MTDLSMPPIATPGDHTLAVEVVLKGNLQISPVANTELVTKGRTMSIDQAMHSGIPRTCSVDSIDYTCMLRGMDDAEMEEMRKQRRHRKRRGNQRLNRLVK